MILGVVSAIGGSLIDPVEFDGEAFNSHVVVLEALEGYTYVSFILYPDGKWEAEGLNSFGGAPMILGSGRWLSGSKGDDFEVRALTAGDSPEQNNMASYSPLSSQRYITLTATMTGGTTEEKNLTADVKIRKITDPLSFVESQFTMQAKVSRTL